MNRSLLIYAALLLGSLGWAYQTWTHEDELALAEKVVLLPGSPDELVSVAYRSPELELTLELLPLGFGLGGGVAQDLALDLREHFGLAQVEDGLVVLGLGAVALLADGFLLDEDFGAFALELSLALDAVGGHVVDAVFELARLETGDDVAGLDHRAGFGELGERQLRAHTQAGSANGDGFAG